jgi:hypothetical protein
MGKAQALDGGRQRQRQLPGSPWRPSAAYKKTIISGLQCPV